ncbi:MAG: sulfite exporter TauE/SafE family protein [Candidatus Aenigmatarchaeota archaeon]|nr:MAG: sulfite exporter TauE/SafE family protein [Candidatus Aenigmarchaeota archaeon]
MADPLFLLAAFVSAIVGTVVGFGSSTIFQPLALFFVDFRTALVLVAIFHIFSNASRLMFFHSGVDKKMLVRFGVPSVVATVAGALLVAYVSAGAFKLLLGIFLILFSASAFTNHRFVIRETGRNEFVGGVLSGFLAGLVGTGGALRGAFLTGFGMRKERYVATASAIALGVDIVRIPVYITSGFLGAQHYATIPFLFVLAFVGTYVGKLVVQRVSQQTFKTLVLAALALIGMKFILDAVA